MLGTAVPSTAYAQNPAGDPAPLWDEFPLEGDGSPDPVPSRDPIATPDDARPATSAAAGDAGAPAGLLAAAGGGLLLLALAGGLLLRSRRASPAGAGAVTAPAAYAARPGAAHSNGAAAAFAANRRVTGGGATETATLADSNGGHAPSRRFARDEAPSTVTAYISLTDAERDLDVPGLVEQEALIREACARERWRLDAVLCDDPRALADGRRRPALDQAIAKVVDPPGARLVVSSLDRLGRSAVELGTVLKRLEAHEATLVALDPGIDTATDAGGQLAEALARIAEAEHDRIAAGTRSGLAAVRAEGRPISRPAVADQPQLRARIRTLREGGMTLQAIADELNGDGVPTLRGGALWRPSSVQAAAGYKRPRQQRAQRDAG